MTDDQKGKCHAIIHAASVAAAGVGAGLAPLPESDNDNALITPIQLTMTISLGQVFDKELTQSAATAALGSVAAATVGRAASQVLVGWIPGFDNAINACTAATITESLGWILAKQFDKGIL